MSNIIFSRLVQFREYLKANGMDSADRELIKLFPGLESTNIPAQEKNDIAFHSTKGTELSCPNSVE